MPDRIYSSQLESIVEKTMLDDMMGLFKTARQAYEAGCRVGVEDAWKVARYCASKVSSERETAGDDAGFHAAEKISALMSVANKNQLDLVAAIRDESCSDKH